MMITASKNPVIVVRLCLRIMGVEVDEESFERAAAEVGDVDLVPGMLVQNIADMNRLCHAGNFSIVIDGGVVRAVLPDDG